MILHLFVATHLFNEEHACMSVVVLVLLVLVACKLTSIRSFPCCTKFGPLSLDGQQLLGFSFSHKSYTTHLLRHGFTGKSFHELSRCRLDGLRLLQERCVARKWQIRSPARRSEPPTAPYHHGSRRTGSNSDCRSAVRGPKDGWSACPFRGSSGDAKP